MVSALVIVIAVRDVESLLLRLLLLPRLLLLLLPLLFLDLVSGEELGADVRENSGCGERGAASAKVAKEPETRAMKKERMTRLEAR